MDVSQYLEIFIEETKEHLQSLNENLLVLEREPENEDTINEIFRAAHSLKGMAGTMGYKRMQRLTHDMENVFSEIRGGNMKVTSDLIDVLFKGLDALEAYLDNIQTDATEGENDNEDIINGLNNILNIGIGKTADAVTPETKPVAAPVTSQADVNSDNEIGTFAKLCLSLNLTTQCFYLGFYYIQTDTPSGDIGNLFRGGKAWLEQNIDNILVRHPLCLFFRNVTFFYCFRFNLLHINSGAVIPYFDYNVIAILVCIQIYRSCWIFTDTFSFLI